MRENRPYGSAGGAARKGRLYPYPGKSLDFTVEGRGHFSGPCLRLMPLPRSCHVLGVAVLVRMRALARFRRPQKQAESRITAAIGA